MKNPGKCSTNAQYIRFAYKSVKNHPFRMIDSPLESCELSLLFYTECPFTFERRWVDAKTSGWMTHLALGTE